MPLEVYHTLDHGAPPLLKPFSSSAALRTRVCCTSARPGVRAYIRICVRVRVWACILVCVFAVHEVEMEYMRVCISVYMWV